MTDKTFTISELAEELEISPSTIRFYEDKGLILPKRSPGNQRVYTQKDRGRLKLILRGKRFGASLDEISEMIGHADIEIKELDQIKTSLYYLEKKNKEILGRMNELQLFRQDILTLKDKLLKRKKDLKAESAQEE